MLRDQRIYLVFNKVEWLSNPLWTWTEEELDNADENGLIGTKDGIDCYLARKIKVYEEEK